MSNSGAKDKGYPNTQGGAGFIFTQLCGGMGGGACPVALGATHYKFKIPVAKFVVFNRRIILRNDTIQGVDIHTDAGATADCAVSLGSRVPWYLSFSVDGNLTDEEMSRGTQFNQAPPFEIEVRDLSLPQPTDAGWDNAIWVHIYWGNSSYVNQYAMSSSILKLIKHDYDIKI